MIRAGFLDPESRQDLTELAQDGLTAHRLARRANALVLLDQGMGYATPVYCPHLDAIERLWGSMHRHVTHNRCHKTFASFKAAILTFFARGGAQKMGHLLRPGNG